VVRARAVAGCVVLLGAAASLPYLACQLAFPTRLADGGACTDGSDTSSDPLNCGACGVACEGGESCFAGVCDGMHVTQVSAGLHACALVKGGRVFCWGSNLFGETGSPPTTQACGASATPCLTTPTEVAGVEHAVAVRAGYYSTCALEQDGSVWCWGQNQAGQLGSATGMGTAGPQPTPSKVGLPAGVTAKAIDVGYVFACALDTAGALHCWGDDTYGELGAAVDGGASASPVRVAATGSSFAAVSTGLDPHACALLQGNGQVVCWGENHLGALGHDPATDPTCPPSDVACSASPRVVAGLTTASVVRAASGLSCALLADGGLSCWGDDGLGQFGDGTPAGSGGSGDAGDAGNGDGGGGEVADGGEGAGDGGGSAVVHFAPVAAADGKAFTAFDARYDFVLALDAKARVWAWGSSSRGALGNGNVGGASCVNDGAPCIALPAEVPAFGAATASVVQVSAGDEFGVALESDGTVWAWGANVDGRLGHAPGAAGSGDLSTCGAPARDEVCNPVPSRVVFP
jgi:alpha-tubulin suppressor-like RCC1 family protein